MLIALVLEKLEFDFGDVGRRLLEQAYRLLAAVPMLVVALAIVWIAWMLGGFISRHVHIRRAEQRNPFLEDLVRTGVRAAVLLVGVLLALEIMQATALVGAVLGTAGVLGVALGFAFKDILENYLAGILMSLRQPFAPRDHVVIDGNEGIIVALTSRATILMTLDGNHVRIPNALVFGSVILNYTRNPNRRFHFDIGVGVQEDLVAAQKLGTDELARMPGVLADPPTRALIVGLGDSNVQVRFFGWVDQRGHDFGAVKSEAIRRVKLALEKAGMDMPEPIYRVQMTAAPSAFAAPPKGAEVEVAQPTSPIPTSSTPTSSTDTRAHRDIEGQLSIGREKATSEDLLDATAPRE